MTERVTMTEGIRPNVGYHHEGRRRLTSKEAAIERWKKAPQEVFKYPSGTVKDSNGNTLYSYSQGSRLLILDQEVMDTCQTPWAEATVDRAFELMGNKKNVQVLERGFGMGIVATRIIQHLEVRGGRYNVIELNKQVAEYADKEWRKKQNAMAQVRAESVIGGGTHNASTVEINVIEGDAYEETGRLVQNGARFDLIISDTFPLTPDERSVNDLLDLETLARCLNPDGIFAFFGYHTGSQGSMNEEQRRMIEGHFNEIHTTYVDVNPPPDYRYFQTPYGPVRRLPVIICKQPKF